MFDEIKLWAPIVSVLSVLLAIPVFSTWLFGWLGLLLGFLVSVGLVVGALFLIDMTFDI